MRVRACTVFFFLAVFFFVLFVELFAAASLFGWCALSAFPPFVSAPFAHNDTKSAAMKIALPRNMEMGVQVRCQTPRNIPRRGRVRARREGDFMKKESFAASLLALAALGW